MKQLGWLALAVVLTWGAPADALIGNDGSTLKDGPKQAAPARERAAPAAARASNVQLKARRVAQPVVRAKKPRKPRPKPRPTPTP